MDGWTSPKLGRTELFAGMKEFANRCRFYPEVAGFSLDASLPPMHPRPVKKQG